MNPGIFGISNGIQPDQFNKVIGNLRNPTAQGAVSVPSIAFFAHAPVILPAVTVGTTMTQIANINGKGIINWCGINMQGSIESETCQYQIYIDGEFYSSGSYASYAVQAYYGLPIIGTGTIALITGGDQVPVLTFQPVPFKRNFRVLASRASIVNTINVYANIDFYR